MPWLNIDNPTKKATIHTDRCLFLPSLEKPKTEGYWMHYLTDADIEENFAAKGLKHELCYCAVCNRNRDVFK